MGWEGSSGIGFGYVRFEASLGPLGGAEAAAGGEPGFQQRGPGWEYKLGVTSKAQDRLWLPVLRVDRDKAAFLCDLPCGVPVGPS